MTGVVSAVAEAVGAGEATRFISYTNPEANWAQDVKLLLAWIVFFAFVTPLMQRLVLWVLVTACGLFALIPSLLGVACCQKTH